MRPIDADALKGKEVRGTIGDVSGDFIPAFEIALAPTIDAEPARHGRWVPYGNIFRTRYKCSACDNGAFDKNFAYGARYCPICGARMNL